LRDKGHFSAEQAGTLAETLGEAAQGDLATKADLAALNADMAAVKADVAGLKADVAALELKIEARIAEAKADILKWVVGAIGFQTMVNLGAPVSLARIFAKLQDMRAHGRPRALEDAAAEGVLGSRVEVGRGGARPTRRFHCVPTFLRAPPLTSVPLPLM
jgi:hypothetical protein